MKYIIYTLIGLATVLLIYNLTQLNFDHLFAGNSAIALTGVFAALCVIVLMLILLVSKSIKNKSDRNS